MNDQWLVTKQTLILRMIAKLHPVTAVVEAGVLGLYEAYRNQRMNTFGKSLVALNIDPPEEHLRRKEFFDAYSATARRVLETTNEQKIKDFAALFASYYEGKTFSSIDHYEEYLSILHDLSHREFQVLVILHKLETASPVKPGENLLMRANRIWKEFSIAVESEVGIVQSELLAVLTRVERTGLYTPIVGAYLDYTGGRGYLTPLFVSFVTALRIDTTKG